MSIEDDLIRDEGIRLKPYRDTVGKMSIGIGRNLDDVGISEQEARALLSSDLARVEAQLSHEFPWWVSRPDPVRRGLINMAFNLGVAGLSKFPRMLACLQAGDYHGAADAALSSLWARQVGARAERIAELFRSAA